MFIVMSFTNQVVIRWGDTSKLHYEHVINSIQLKIAFSVSIVSPKTLYNFMKHEYDR